jgi:hypothetical protein
MTGAKMRDLAEVLRDELVMRGWIAGILKDNPMTIPEVAQALSQPSREVTLWMMAMRRYGLITELPKARADDYYQYKLAE